MHQPFFHVGIVVEDLEAAMTELSTTIGLTWRAPHHSTYGEWEIKVVYSIEGPPFIELVQGGAGGPWDSSRGSPIDHIGYYAEDVVAEAERLAEAGLTFDFDPHTVGKGGTFCYLKAVAAGARIELVSATTRALLEK